MRKTTCTHLFSTISDTKPSKILIDNIEGNKNDGKPTTTTTDEPTQIPIQHSRKLPILVASSEILDDMTKDFLNSPVGSCYTYNPSFSDPDQGDIVSDPFSQTAEFILRGHSSLLEGSFTYLLLNSKERDDMPVLERISIMESLLKRVEKESRAYQKIFIDAHSTLALSEDIPKESPELHALPGPTTAMYDIVLDSWAISKLPNALENCQKLFKKILSRHFKDGASKNTNVKSIPTQLTFNAVIRAASNTDAKTLKQRDDALDAALWTYDKMHHCDATDRNSATYVYLLQSIKKFVPESRAKGDICHGIFHMAKDEEVVDENVIEELVTNKIPSQAYNNFVKEKLLQQKIPEAWSSNTLTKRYHSKFAIY